MTIYRKTETRSVGGKNLTVMIQEGTDSLIADAAASVLDQSRKLLEVANGVVNSEKGLPPDVAKLAQHYFLAPEKNIPEKALEIIRTTITKTRTGLAGDVSLKTGQTIKNAGPAVAGRVRPEVVAEA